MAYLHCHSCEWGQDDFWRWKWTWRFWKFRPFGYNPISLMIEDIRGNLRPRYIKVNPGMKEAGLEVSSMYYTFIINRYMIANADHFLRFANRISDRVYEYTSGIGYPIRLDPEVKILPYELQRHLKGSADHPDSGKK